MARVRPIIADVQTVSSRAQGTDDAVKKRRAAPATVDHGRSTTFVNTIGSSMDSAGQEGDNNYSTIQQQPGEYGSAHDIVDSSIRESISGRHSELCLEAITMETGPSLGAPHHRCPASISVMQKPVRLTSIRSTIEGSNQGRGSGMLRLSKRARTEETGGSSLKSDLPRKQSLAGGDARTSAHESNSWRSRTGGAGGANGSVAATQELFDVEHRLTPTSRPTSEQSNLTPLANRDSSDSSVSDRVRQFRRPHHVRKMSQQAGATPNSTPDPVIVYKRSDGQEVHGLPSISQDEWSYPSPKTNGAQPIWAERTMHRSYHHARLYVPVNMVYPAVMIAPDVSARASESSDEEEDRSDGSDENMHEATCESGEDQQMVSSRHSTTEGMVRIPNAQDQSKTRARAAVDDNDKASREEKEDTKENTKEKDENKEKKEEAEDFLEHPRPPAVELYEVDFEDKPAQGRRTRRRNVIKPITQSNGQSAKPWTSLTPLKVTSYDREEDHDREEDQRIYQLGEDVNIYTTHGRSEPARILDIRDLNDGRQLLAILWLYGRKEAERQGLRRKDWPPHVTHVLTNWLQIVLWNTIEDPCSPREVKVAEKLVLNVGSGPAKLLADKRHEVAWTKWTGEQSETADEG